MEFYVRGHHQVFLLLFLFYSSYQNRNKKYGLRVLVSIVFEQVHKDKNNEGTGLGLPLCKMLTELHGGRFILESKVNVGTKAIVILPASRVRKKRRIYKAAAGKVALKQ